MDFQSDCLNERCYAMLSFRSPIELYNTFLLDEIIMDIIILCIYCKILIDP